MEVYATSLSNSLIVCPGAPIVYFFVDLTD
jgi:hypothetical protein